MLINAHDFDDEQAKQDPYPFCVLCTDCGTASADYATAEKARAAWNRRPAPQWSTEPPTENGWYWLNWTNAEGVWTCIPVEVKYELLGGLGVFHVWFVKSHKFDVDDEEVPYCFNGGTATTSDIEIMSERQGFEVRWHKIELPALPEKGGNDE